VKQTIDSIALESILIKSRLIALNASLNEKRKNVPREDGTLIPSTAFNFISNQKAHQKKCGSILKPKPGLHSGPASRLVPVVGRARPEGHSHGGPAAGRRSRRRVPLSRVTTYSV
jgi:hypothetical protein